MLPSLAHPMGTDNIGRDIFAQVLQGGRVSLAVGVTAMLLSLFLGTLIGVLAGYFRRLDGLLMRMTDLFLALPILPLLLVVIMLFRDTLRAAIGPEIGHLPARSSSSSASPAGCTRRGSCAATCWR